jgi:eukaryotic-like serine/threonine-protein kinase
MSGSWYELLARTRTGPTGVSYVGRLRDAPASRLVGVQRLHPQFANDPTARRALLAEATLAARLRHPNVVSVHEIEDLGNELLLVTDYVEGASIAQLATVVPILPRPQVLRILLDAAAGLAAVHAARDEAGAGGEGVHRDLAPDNLLVGVDGCTRITDFGIPRIAASVQRQGAAGLLGGRYGYMAPEYLMGYATDERADVFSLGVVAWELLAGKPLFTAATDSSTMQRVVRLEAPELSAVAPELGVAFDGIMEGVLAKNPANRFPSAAHFAHALAAAAPWVGGLASREHVAITVDELVGDDLLRRRLSIEEMRTSTSGVYARA